MRPLTCSKFLLEGIQILLQSNLHPHQAHAGHDTGGKDDKSTEGITDLAASEIVSPDHKNKFNQEYKGDYEHNFIRNSIPVLLCNYVFK